MLNPLELAAKSLEKIKGKKIEFASSFYENLLTTNPNLKPFFKHGDLTKQKKMLSGFLIIISKRWQQPEILASILKRIGGNHFRYGVRPEYFTLFKEVFLITLAKYLGENWNKEMQQAWIQAFESIIQIMLEGYEETKANVVIIPKIS